MLIKAQLRFAITHKDAKTGVARVFLEGEKATFTGAFKIRENVGAEAILVTPVRDGKEYTFTHESVAFSDESTKWLTLECEVDFTESFTVNVQSYDGTQVSFTPVVDKIVQKTLTIASDTSQRRQRSYSEEDLSPASKKGQETSATFSSSSSSSSLSSSFFSTMASSFPISSLPAQSSRHRTLAHQIIQDSEGKTVFCVMSHIPPVTAKDMTGFKQSISVTAANITDFIFNENEIGDGGCLELQQVETIRYLAVADNGISDIGAIALSRIPHLQKLVIASNEITGDGLIALINNNKGLAYLDASYNGISDEAAEKILSIHNSGLVYLDLTGNDAIRPVTLEKISAWLKHNEENLPKTISCAK